MSKVVSKIVFLILCLFVFSSTMAQDIPLYLEDFEYEGEGSRYFKSHTFNEDIFRSYFIIKTPEDSIDLVGVSNITNTNYVVMEETETASASTPSDGIVTIITDAIGVDSFSQLTFTFDVGASTSGLHDSYNRTGARDWLDVDVRYDGGSWTTIMKFRNGPTFNTNNQRLYEDVDLDNIGGEDGGSILNLAMQRFSATTSVTGSSAEFRVRARSNAYNEEIFYDRLLVEGTPLNTPPSTLNRMLYQYMGFTTDNLRTNLYARNHASAINYEFEISGAGFTTQNIISPTNKLALKDVSGMTYNRTYNLRHRIITSGGPGVWSDAYYGFWVINVGAPSTQLSATDCGTNKTLLTDPINFDLLGGATNYRATVDGPSAFSTVYTLNSTNSSFSLSDAGATEAGTYSISIAGFISGAWIDYSDTCTITVNDLTPQISLKNFTCGGTITNAKQVVYAEKVSDTDYYEWRLTGDGDPYTSITVQTPERYIRLSEVFPLIEYNETYNLRVRFSVNATLSPFSNTCNFTLDAPTINITSPTCSSTILDSTIQIKTSYVAGSTYEFSVFNTGNFDTTFTRSGPNFRIEDLNEVYDLTTLNVSARPVISGVSTNFGDTCTFTYSQARLAGGKKYISLDDISSEDIKVYPNPFNEFLIVNLGGTQVDRVELSNILGERIRIEFENNGSFIQANTASLPYGQYLLIIVKTDQTKKVVRIIK